MTESKTEMTELDGSEVFSDWQTLLGSEQNKNTSVDDFSLDNLMGNEGDDFWLKEFQKSNLPGMKLAALKLLKGYVHDFKDELAKMKTQQQIFLLSLPTTHLNDLRIAGLSDDQITDISKGLLPVNWTVHLRYPLAYGGKIIPENMVFVPEYPFHEEIHRFINKQIVTDAGIICPKVLYIPFAEDKIYVPFASTEIASQVQYLDLSEKS